MPIPTFQKLMLPVLQFISDGQEHSIKAIREHISTVLELTPSDFSEKLASGTGVFTNRVAWAVVKLKMGGAVESTAKGMYRITQHGTDLVKLGWLRLAGRLRPGVSAKGGARGSDGGAEI